MSGYSDAAVRRKGVLDADIDVLEKPLSPAALCRRVCEVLGTRSLEPALARATGKL